MMDKNDNIVTQPTVGGMMLRKRVKEGKKYVQRMVYVERPSQSKDPLHNMKRDAKRAAAQLAKEQKAEAQKEIKKQMDTFDVRFILAFMNKFAPRGYQFVVQGDDNKIAMKSVEIMGNQKPRGAFVSDISFGLLFGLFGDLLNGKIAGPDENLYERIRLMSYEKPSCISKEQHNQYMRIIKDINMWNFGIVPPFSLKRAPTKIFTDKNAVLVQGIMDSGQMPPKYLNNRMHNIVNGVVLWTFCRAMYELKLSKLQKLRKVYRNNLVNKAIIPGKKFGIKANLKRTENISQKQKELEQRLDRLLHHALPQAIAEAQDEIVSLHRQMAQLVELQPVKFAMGSLRNGQDDVKPSKKLKHSILSETEDLCSGVAQRRRVEKVRSDISKTIGEINGAPEQVVQPARDLMPDVFYFNSDCEQPRKIGQNTSVFKQLLWLTMGKIQRTK